MNKKINKEWFENDNFYQEYTRDPEIYGDYIFKQPEHIYNTTEIFKLINQLSDYIKKVGIENILDKIPFIEILNYYNNIEK